MANMAGLFFTMQARFGDVFDQIDKLESRISKVERQAKTIDKAFDGPARGAANSIKSVGTAAESASKSLQRVEQNSKAAGSSFAVMKAQALGFVAATAAMGVAQKGFSMIKGSIIGMNATLETSTLQFETLMGDADRAKEHVKSLFQFAKDTPFETGPIILASKRMQTFGGDALNTKKNLMLFGDAAAATGAGIDELGFWFGRMYSAMQAGKPFGEATARLSELAVISPQLTIELGKMQKRGASASEMWQAVEKDLNKFGGAMKKQANTWSGLTSTLADVISLGAAKAFEPLFRLAKSGVAALNSLFSSKMFERGIALISSSIDKGISSISTFFNYIKTGEVIVRRALGMSGGDVEAYVEKWKSVPKPIKFFISVITATIEAVTRLGYDLATLIGLTDKGNFEGPWSGWLAIIKLVWGAIDTVITAIRDTLSPVADQVLSKMNIDSEKLASNLGNVFAGVLLVSGGFAAWSLGAVALGQMAATAAPLAKLVATLATAHPILLLIAVAAGAAFLVWNSNLGGIQEKTYAVVEAVKQRWPEIEAKGREIFERIRINVEEFVNRVRPIIEQFVVDAVALFQRISAWIEENWPKIRDLAARIWNEVYTTIKGHIDNILSEIQPLVDLITDAWPGIVDAARAVWTAVYTLVSENVQKIITWFQQNWPLIEETIITAWERINKVIEIAINVIGEIIVSGVNFIRAVWSAAGDEFMAIAKIAWEMISAIINNRIDTILNIIKLAMQLFTGDWSGAWETVKTILKDQLDLVGVLVEGAFKIVLLLLKAGLDLILAASIDIGKKIGNALIAPFKGIGGFIADALNSAIDVFSGFIGGINSVLGFLKLPQIPMPGRVSSPSGSNDAGDDITFAQGGIARRPTFLVGEEAPTHPEFVIPTNPAYSSRATDLWMQAGKALGVPGFQLGGIIGAVGDVASMVTKGPAGVVNEIIDKLSFPTGFAGDIARSLVNIVKDGVLNLVKSGLDKAKEAFVASPANVPGSVTDWLMEAIRITGVPESWLAGLQIIAMNESTGNPNAINEWDVNAQRGDPSRGLMQTIGATFSAYAAPGMNNIYNPVHNAVAAINYIKARYGDISRVPGVASVNSGGAYRPYALGGMITEPVLGIGRSGARYLFGERGSELVTPLANGGMMSNPSGLLGSASQFANRPNAAQNYGALVDYLSQLAAASGYLKTLERDLSAVNDELKNQEIILSKLPDQTTAHAEAIKNDIQVLKAWSDQLSDQIDLQKSAEEQWQKSRTAVDGFTDAMLAQVKNSALVDQFGELGAASIDALQTAIVENTPEAGAAALVANNMIIQQLKEMGVKNWYEVGVLLNDALYASLADPTNKDKLAEYLNILEAAKPPALNAAQLFSEEFAEATFGENLKNKLGSNLFGIFENVRDLITNEITPQTVETLAQQSAQLMESLKNTLPPEMAAQLGGEYMDAMRRVIEEKTPEAEAAFIAVAERINAAMQLIPKNFAELPTQVQGHLMSLYQQVDQGLIPFDDAIKRREAIIKIIPDSFAELPQVIQPILLNLAALVDQGLMQSDEAVRRSAGVLKLLPQSFNDMVPQIQAAILQIIDEYLKGTLSIEEAAKRITDANRAITQSIAMAAAAAASMPGQTAQPYSVSQSSTSNAPGAGGQWTTQYNVGGVAGVSHTTGTDAGLPVDVWSFPDWLMDAYGGNIQAIMYDIQNRLGRFANIQNRAQGGPVSGWSWVGERGPELARFGAGSTVMSNPQSLAYINTNQREANAGVTTQQFATMMPVINTVSEDDPQSRFAWNQGDGDKYIFAPSLSTIDRYKTRRELSRRNRESARRYGR